MYACLTTQNQFHIPLGDRQHSHSGHTKQYHASRLHATQLARDRFLYLEFMMFTLVLSVISKEIYVICESFEINLICSEDELE